MICEHFKISDTDCTDLDICDFLKIELRGACVQSYDTKWDETTIAMQTQSDEEPLQNLYFRQLENSDQLRQRVALNIQDTVRTSEPKSYTKLRKRTRQTYFSSRDRLGDKPYPVVPDKEQGDCNAWVSKGHCSRGQACSFKPCQAKRRKGRNNRQRSPSPSPTRKSSDTDDTGRKFRDTGDEQKGTSSSGATDKPLCFKF